MLNALRILGATDLRIGGRYLELMMSNRNELLLGPLELLSEPNAEGMIRVRRTPVFIPENVFECEEFLCDIGVDLAEGDNFHRLFEDTSNNHLILEDAVRRQDVETWLTFLGIGNPKNELEQRLKDVEEAEDALFDLAYPDW